MKISNKGFFNAKVVKTIAFTLLTICLLGCIVLSILAIWDYANRDTLWRMIATLGVIGLGSAIFAYINGVFGD
jgi:uncharacterized membrane protein YqjE